MDRLRARPWLGLAAALSLLFLVAWGLRAASGPADTSPAPKRYRTAKQYKADAEALSRQRREAVVRLSPKRSPQQAHAKSTGVPARKSGR
jgi:hypothetical protein